MNPCNCQRPTCRLCWLAANDPRYQKLWATRQGTTTQPVKPTSGPGTELQRLMKELGFAMKPSCGCAAKARQMDQWGVAGCRERVDEIHQWLTEAKNKAGWLETLRGAALAVTGGLAIDPLDVEGSLIRIAIERAEHTINE